MSVQEKQEAMKISRGLENMTCKEKMKKNELVQSRGDSWEAR